MNRHGFASRMMIFFAMGLVAAAIATALSVHVGLSAIMSLAAGVGLYACFFLAHTTLWRAREDDEAHLADEDDEASRATALARTLAAAGAGSDDLEDDTLDLPPHRAAAKLTANSRGPQSERLTPGDIASLNAAHRASLADERRDAGPSLDDQLADRKPEAPEFSLDDAVAPRPSAETSGPSLTASAAAPAAPSPFDRSALDKPAPQLPPFVTGRASGSDDALDVITDVTAGAAPEKTPELTAPPLPKQPALAAPPMPPASPLGPKEADVEELQGAIKQLLEQVNEAERAQAPGANPAEQHTTRDAAELFSAEPAINKSVDALNLAAGAMRSATETPTATSAPQQTPGAIPPPLPVAPPQLPAEQSVDGATAPSAVRSPSEQRARILSEAISAGRIAVLLEPILGLEDQRTRHYEVTVQLKDAMGSTLDVFGKGPDLRGTGLLPLFDSISVTKVAAVAKKLGERGKSGSIFSRFNGESIADDQFVGMLADHLRTDNGLAAQLVLSFTQADVRGLSPAEWDAIADMRALGFRFAISSVTDLDMNFEDLAEQGFAFAKLDADVFLNGLQTGQTRVPAKDVCRYLARLGLTLVVENIADDSQRARIFGFGVLLGQGELFGGRKAVRANAMQPTAAQPAVA